MSDQTSDSSRITIDSIYACRGDQGETSLVGGHQVAKDNARIEAYDVVDELNAFVGSPFPWPVRNRFRPKPSNTSTD